MLDLAKLICRYKVLQGHGWYNAIFDFGYSREATDLFSVSTRTIIFPFDFSHMLLCLGLYAAMFGSVNVCMIMMCIK